MRLDLGDEAPIHREGKQRLTDILMGPLGADMFTPLLLMVGPAGTDEVKETLKEVLDEADPGKDR